MPDVHFHLPDAGKHMDLYWLKSVTWCPVFPFVTSNATSLIIPGQFLWSLEKVLIDYTFFIIPEKFRKQGRSQNTIFHIDDIGSVSLGKR